MEVMWQRREIENYFCREEALLAFARHAQPDDLFGHAERERREEVIVYPRLKAGAFSRRG
jgi:hypothetical protein